MYSSQSVSNAVFIGIRHMTLTRKTQRRRRTTRASTSSDEVGNSSPPTDLLALGQHLVRELGLAESTDTLARWIAHEIAEAMTAVAVARSEPERASARREALHLIARLWEHRAQLPNGAHPLAPFRAMLGAISLFTEDDSRPWWGYRHSDQTEAMVFRAFTGLMPCLLLLRAPGVSEIPGPGSTEYEHLEEAERAILDALGDWLDRRTPKPPSASTRPNVAIARAEGDLTDDETTEAIRDDDAQSDDLDAGIRISALEAIAVLERGLAEIRARLEAPASARSGDQVDIDPDDV